MRLAPMFKLAMAVIVLFIFFSLTSHVDSSEQSKENRYYCLVNNNPRSASILSFFRYLFIMYFLHKETLLFKEKENCAKAVDNGGNTPNAENCTEREYNLFGKNRHYARLSFKDGKYEGFASFGKFLTGKFKPEQIMVLFQIFDIAKQENGGEQRWFAYETESGKYTIYLEAPKAGLCDVNSFYYQAFFFKMRVQKNAEHFADVYFWTANGNESGGQILKCIVEIAAGPAITATIENDP